MVALPLAITAHQIVFGTSEPPTFFLANPPKRAAIYSTGQPLSGNGVSRPKSWPYHVLTPPAWIPYGKGFTGIFARQHSFNWQSTAFVKRGLWVRLPLLALV